MSDSVALVAVNRIMEGVRNQIEPSESLVRLLVSTKGISREAAKEKILASTVNLALRLSHNDEKSATLALVIVKGVPKRLPQCTKLLRKYPSEIVAVVYEIKNELVASNISLRNLCEFVEQTDGDMEGEALQLKGLLEEIGMAAFSREQEWAFHHRIREGLAQGRLVEAIVDEIQDDLRKRNQESFKMSLAQSEAYYRGT